MSDLRSRSVVRFPRVTERWLKNAAALLTLLVNFGAVVVERGLIGVEGYSYSQLLTAMDVPGLTQLVGLAAVLRLSRGLLPPLFAFLLVEGFLHTSNYARYLAGVSLSALVSELAYDFAMTGQVLDLSQQSPMLALTVCLVMLYILRLPERMDTLERIICQTLIILCAVFWALLLRVESGLETVLLTAVFYLLREKRTARLLTGVLVSLLDPTGPMAFCAIALYSGERKLKVNKYAYYLLYPFELILFGVTVHFFL